MANYNSKLLYNAGIKSGGANYNSAAFFIVEISDSGNGTDALSPILANVFAADIGTGQDIVDLLQKTVYVSDSGVGQESASINNTLAVISENGIGNDTVYPVANLAISDTGSGVDTISNPTQYPASKYFIVTNQGILMPLGVRVLGDSRKEMMPSTRDNSEEIPGRHGEIDFGNEFKSRLLELHVVTPNGLSPIEKEQLRRKCAMYLNPVAGTKKLIFQDDEGVQYEVKFSGKIDPTNYPTWMEFTIPFKMCNPIFEATGEKTLVGSGTIANEGTFETPLIIEMVGPVAYPSVAIGTRWLKYDDILTQGQTLIINTEDQTAILVSISENPITGEFIHSTVNAMADYNGIFPFAQPGNTEVTSNSGNITIRWKEKYL